MARAHPVMEGHPHGGEGRHVAPFWRHFLEMLAVMVAGMIAAGYIVVRAVGLTSWDAATFQYPTQCLLAMAVGMSVPMMVWMRLRGMGTRSSYEMAAAMILPVIPFLCLVWFNVTEGAQCGAYCIASVVVMFALMRFRPTEYAHH